MEETILKVYGKQIEELRKKIDAHIANGGSIYDTKLNLPYYEYMRTFIRRTREKIDPNFSKFEAYKLCGFHYDAEYDEYASFIKNLSLYADENNFVDQIKKLKGSNSLRTQLKKFANRMNCSSSDYLILMTNYRYKEVIISTDYIQQLRTELHREYPGGNITNIKRENPRLYEKLRHVCKYHPELGQDMQSVAEYFGLMNDRFSNTNIYHHLQEKKIIKQLREVCPDGNIDKLSKEYPSLYFQVTKCSTSHNQSVLEWAESNGFSYNGAINVGKLTKTKVDAEIREREINAIKTRLISQFPPKYTNDREEYYYNKEIAQLVVKELDKISSM